MRLLPFRRVIARPRLEVCFSESRHCQYLGHLKIRFYPKVWNVISAAFCPVTERVSERMVRLPFFNALTEDDQAHIVESIHECRC